MTGRPPKYGFPPLSGRRQDAELGPRQEGRRKRSELSTFSNGTGHEEHSIKAGRHARLLGVGPGSPPLPPFRCRPGAGGGESLGEGHELWPSAPYTPASQAVLTPTR